MELMSILSGCLIVMVSFPVGFVLGAWWKAGSEEQQERSYGTTGAPTRRSSTEVSQSCTTRCWLLHGASVRDE